MTSEVKSLSSEDGTAPSARETTSLDARGWVRVGAIAAASAVLGGLAAAWFYRKTLTKLRDAENEIPEHGATNFEDVSPEDF
jgi:hypothetical protein